MEHKTAMWSFTKQHIFTCHQRKRNSKISLFSLQVIERIFKKEVGKGIQEKKNAFSLFYKQKTKS